MLRGLCESAEGDRALGLQASDTLHDLGSSRSRTPRDGDRRALSGACAHRERDEPAAHLRRYASRVQRAHGTRSDRGDRLLPDADRFDCRFRPALRRRNRAPAFPAAWRRCEHRLRRPGGGRAVLRAQKRLRHLPRFGASPGAGRGMAARDVQGRARGSARPRRHDLGRILRAWHVLPPARPLQVPVSRRDGQPAGLRHHHGEDRARKRDPSRFRWPAPARACAVSLALLG